MNFFQKGKEKRDFKTAENFSGASFLRMYTIQIRYSHHTADVTTRIYS